MKLCIILVLIRKIGTGILQIYIYSELLRVYIYVMKLETGFTAEKVSKRTVPVDTI